MKTFTCREMGGGQRCNTKISGETLAELIQNASAHIQQMAATGDGDHQDMMDKMFSTSGTTEGDELSAVLEKKWDAKPVDIRR